MLGSFPHLRVNLCPAWGPDTRASPGQEIESRQKAIGYYARSPRSGALAQTIRTPEISRSLPCPVLSLPSPAEYFPKA
jgi:hypothetical protein